MEGSIRKLIDTKNLEEVLADFAKDFKENYRDHLVSSGREATGALVRSVDANIIEEMVRIGDEDFVVSINLEEYWKYVEEDTPAHWPPTEAIIKWIEAKPIIPSPSRNGKIPSTKDLAFLIGRAMAGLSPNQAQLKNPAGGTTGSHDFERTKEGLLMIYRPRLQAALRLDMEEYLKRVMGEK